MSDTRQWQDLMPRVLSGLVLAVAGVAALWVGGWVFIVVVCAACGLMIWEAGRMFEAASPAQDGLFAAGAVLLATVLPGLFALPLMAAAGAVCASRAGRDKPLYLGVAVWTILACFAILLLRLEAGLVWVFWLVAVVVATDVAGYFAGRSLGGPKFWPRVSPKKTWSGTIAGWVAAAVVGAVFAGATGAGAALVPFSVLVSLVSQLGDIAESAIKRRAGVKDSSALIPGHGGVFDRFDGLMGGGAVTLVLWSFNLVSSGG